MSESNLPATAGDLLKGLAVTHQRVKSLAGTGGEQYLKLAKSGLWIFGIDDTDVQENSAWAVDPNSFVQGYIAWEPDEKKPAAKLGEEMVSATAAPIDKAALPDVGGPWAEQLGLSLMCLTGEDKGIRLNYTTTSKGGLRAINGVLGEVIQKLQSGEGDAIIPVVHLEVDSYTHKRYGKVYLPVFNIIRWESMSNRPTDVAEEVEAKTEVAAEAPAPAPAPERTRRRRVAA